MNKYAFEAGVDAFYKQAAQSNGIGPYLAMGVGAAGLGGLVGYGLRKGGYATEENHLDYTQELLDKRRKARKGFRKHSNLAVAGVVGGIGGLMLGSYLAGDTLREARIDQRRGVVEDDMDIDELFAGKHNMRPVRRQLEDEYTQNMQQQQVDLARDMAYRDQMRYYGYGYDRR